jgi:hypothetical protein
MKSLLRYIVFYDSVQDDYYMNGDRNLRGWTIEGGYPLPKIKNLLHDGPIFDAFPVRGNVSTFMSIVCFR